MDTTAATTAVRRNVGPIQLWIAVGLLGSVGMVLSGSGIGSIPAAGRPTAGGSPCPIGTGLGAHLAFYASVAVLLAGWAGVGAHAYRGGLSVRTAWLILVLWGLPFFLGAPLFSRDLYSYVAQGQLARHGLNPYVVAAVGPRPGQPAVVGRLGVASHRLALRTPVRGGEPRRGLGLRRRPWSPRSWSSGPSSWSAWPS